MNLRFFFRQVRVFSRIPIRRTGPLSCYPESARDTHCRWYPKPTGRSLSDGVNSLLNFSGASTSSGTRSRLPTSVVPVMSSKNLPNTIPTAPLMTQSAIGTHTSLITSRSPRVDSASGSSLIITTVNFRGFPGTQWLRQPQEKSWVFCPLRNELICQIALFPRSQAQVPEIQMHIRKIIPERFRDHRECTRTPRQYSRMDIHLTLSYFQPQEAR